MALDTAPTGLAPEISAGMPVIASGAEAIAAAQAFAAAIAAGAADRDRAGTVPGPELAAFDASGLLAIAEPRPDLSHDPAIRQRAIRDRQPRNRNIR